MHGRADCAAPHRRVAAPFMAGDQQQQPVPTSNGTRQRVIDRAPGLIQAHPVKIDGAVGRNRSFAQPLVPAAVKRSPVSLLRRRGRPRRKPDPF